MNEKKKEKSSTNVKIKIRTYNAHLISLDVLNFKDHIKENFLPCAQPWASVHINNDGNVFPCLAVSMGNIRKKNIKDIIWSFDEKEYKVLKIDPNQGNKLILSYCPDTFLRKLRNKSLYVSHADLTITEYKEVK